MGDFERAKKILRPRRGKRSTALRKDFVLKRGEIYFEVPESGIATGPGKMVMGDGEHPYSQLPYFSEAAGDVKADKVQYATDGDIAGLDATGNLTDSGIRADNIVTKLHEATPGDICVFDSNGNIADSAISVLEVNDNKAAIETIFNYYGSKNILPFPYYDEAGQRDGVTFSFVGQCVDVNGIVDTEAHSAPLFCLANELSIVKGRYIITGNQNANTQTISNSLFLRVDIYEDGDTSHNPDRTIVETESGSIVEITNDTTVVNVFIQSVKETRYNHVIVYPMLRLENANNATYVPFANTNRELTELKQNKKLDQVINVDGTNQTTVEAALRAINVLAGAVKTIVGSLEDLDTTTKTSIVAAINDINSNLELSSLADVVINNPTNSQALVYDSELGKWKNDTAIPSIATVDSVGTVKPDGTTITIDADGTIHGAAEPYVAQPTAPDNHKIIWFDTAHGGVEKFWNGTEWQISKSVWS